MTVDPQDEGRHEPDAADELWNESWYFDFAAADGSLGGYVRVGLYEHLSVSHSDAIPERAEPYHVLRDVRPPEFRNPLRRQPVGILR